MTSALHTHREEVAGVGVGGTDARHARLAMSGLLAAQGPGALDARTGVLHGPGSTSLLTGTSDTGPMTIAIQPNNWVGSRGSANGPYLGVTPGVVKVPLGAAPASGSRMDVVWERQQDKTDGVPTPDTTSAPQWGVTAGPANGSKPTNLPVGAVEIGTVQLTPGVVRTDASVGVTITNTARQIVARGAPIPVRSEAERDALTTYPGLHVTRVDLGGVIQRWITGSVWRSYLDATDLAGTTGNLSLDIGLYKAADVSLGGTPKWRRRGDGMALSGGITNSTTPFTAPAGNWYKFGNLPAGTWPGIDHAFSVLYASGSGYAIAWVRVRANGEIQFLPTATAGPGFTVGLEGVTWEIGA